MIADARSLPIRSDSVRLVLTSPPYFAMREYGNSTNEIGLPSSVDQYVGDLVEATSEMARVITPDGNIFVNLGDRYVNRSRLRRSSHQPGLHGMESRPEFSESWAEASARGRVITSQIAGVPERSLALAPLRYVTAVCDRLGLLCLGVNVWTKRSGLPDPTARARTYQRHEYVFHFAKRVPNFGSEVCGSSVWDLPTARGKSEHGARWGSELVSHVIDRWSEPGDIVLDPFGGTGTTAAVACDLGRRGVSIDLYDWADTEVASA